MDAFITALEAVITPAALWGVIAGSATFIGVVVLFSFGYRFVKGLISGVSKGKAKMK
ncbi:MAG: hypothetical protein LBT19_02540 [Candidatus Nomurabacteria bacterium]|jgi:hypothetical protein|nr:hypothetical protein [Candidatus Nomurabacteria bacterium]